MILSPDLPLYLRMRLKKEGQSESNTFLEFGNHDVLEEREKEENEGIKFVEFGTHDVWIGRTR